MNSSERSRQPWRKTRRGASSGYFRAEAAGLEWLQVAHGAPVPQVHSVAADALVMDRVPVHAATQSAAALFGADLARTHAVGAPAFGAPPPNAPSVGWIADLPMAYGRYESFGPMYAMLRVAPYVAMAIDRGALQVSDGAIFGRLVQRLTDEDPQLCGPAQTPARLHGDLWSGNVLWAPTADGRLRGWLIDPAAYGGHPETDLAMLALFPPPFFDAITDGYEQVAPLATGWRARVALHQVYPLLVHAVLFGGGYGAQAVMAARGAMRV